MKNTTFFYLLLFIGFALTSIGQNEFSKWYFGHNAGLDFSTSPPTILTNGVVNTAEGVATICDNTGNLLFYTDGMDVANSQHQLMANGGGLVGDGSSTQAALIVKKPGSNTIYYIFTTSIGGTPGACYSIVDMSLAAGLGSVTVKNVPIDAPSCEKQVAVRHCNGRDIWIITHHYSNEFKAYLLTSAGLNTTAVTSAIGETPINSSGAAIIGHIKISPDGKKLALASFSNSIPASLGDGGFQLFDFDAATGVVSNSLILIGTSNMSPGQSAYGVEFSPDGTKLYGTTNTQSASATSILYQWNVCAPTHSAIIASQYSVSLGNIMNVGSVQWAVDGKLYIAMGSTQYLSVINAPNASGSAMNLSLNAQSIAPKSNGIGLPNYINGYTHTVPSLFTNTLACQTSSFSPPPVPTFSSGCSPTPYLPGNYVWDFGEPSSGAANSSTLANPLHNYAATGTYSVTLIIYSACTNDTLKKTVTITTPGPPVAVSGNFTICKGEKYNYTASGATTYSWSSGSAIPSVALSPTITSVYTVSGTASGCTNFKTFTITVNPCTGISTLENNGAFNVFPNPFKDYISIEATGSSELLITDLSGNIVLKSKLSEGKNEIITTDLKSGIYLIQAKNGEKVWRGRFVKIE